MTSVVVAYATKYGSYVDARKHLDKSLDKIGQTAEQIAAR